MNEVLIVKPGLNTLLERRVKFLQEHPEMHIVQQKIDYTLEHIGNNPIERCIAMQVLLQQSACKLSSHMEALFNEIQDNDVIGKLDDIIAKLKSISLEDE